MSDDPLFDDWVARAKEADIVAVAQRLGAQIKRAGKDWVGPCPACGGKDRFVLTPAHREPHKRFMCRGTQGGDVISMVEHILSVPFVTAVEEITGEPPPKGESRAVSPEVMRERREEQKDAARRTKAEEKRERAEKILAAADVWALGRDIRGTHADAYLAARGISMTDELANDLRFVPSLEYRGYPDADAEHEVPLGSFPCMIAAARDNAGELIAVHRTYLDPDQPAKLRPPGDRTQNKAKKIMGRPVGGFIRLSSLSSCLAVGEGIETAASFFRLGLGPEDLSIASAYSIGNLCGPATGTIPHPTIAKRVIANGEPDRSRHGMVVPDEVETIILLGDGDSDRAWTFAQLLTGARRHRAQGKEVLVCIAPEGRDFNDLLMAVEAGEQVDLPPILSFEEFEKLALSVVRPPFRSRFNALFLTDLDAPGPEHEYMIDGFMTLGDKSVLGGPSQSGKSFLAIHAGLCVATHTLFFGQKVKPGLVVYHAGEGARGVKKRLRAWRKHFGISYSEKTPFVLLQAPLDLYRADGDTGPLIDEIKSICGMFDVPLRLVVIDTLATATAGADENSGKDMGMVMANIARIHAETGAHVCLVHHMNAKGEKLRGHTSIYANVDQVVLVTRDEQTKVRTVRVDKQKDDDTGQPFQFELAPIEIGSRPDGRPITSCVVVDVGTREKALRDRKNSPGLSLRPNEELPFRALLKALREKGQQAPSDLQLPLGTRVVEWRHWKEEFAKIAPIEPPKDGDEAGQKRWADALRKRMESAGQSLLQWGFIGRENPWVWWTGKAAKGHPETYDRADNMPAPTARASAGHADAPADDISDFLEEPAQ